MRRPRPLLLILVLEAFAWASDRPMAAAPPRFCVSSAAGASACDVSKQDLKEAKAAFSHGLKLQHEQRFDEALEQFEIAARLVPEDVEFLTARELSRQQLIYDHLERGNSALTSGNQVEALAEFRMALHLDPENQFARQRLQDAWASGRRVPPDRRLSWATPPANFDSFPAPGRPGLISGGAPASFRLR